MSKQGTKFRWLLVIIWMSLMRCLSGQFYISCQHCWCRNASITCEEPAEVEAPPPNVNFTAKTTSIVITRQPRLVELDSKSLQPYVHLMELTIQDTGLHFISPDAFAFNPQLRKIDLRRNQLTVVPWTLFVPLSAPEISLEGNPLVCECVNRWIQLSSELSTHSPKWPRISTSPKGRMTCNDQENNQHLLSEFQFRHCELPVVNLSRETIELNENDTLNVECTALGQPEPLVSWISEHNRTADVVSVDSGRKLHIGRIQVEDAGSFTCAAENVVGRVSKVVDVVVNSLPKIVRLMNKQHFHWCVYYEIKGHPLPSHTWLFNGQPFNYTDDVIDASTNPHQGCLTFKTQSFNREGNYTLIASNVYGTSNRSIQVHFDHLTPAKEPHVTNMGRQSPSHQTPFNHPPPWPPMNDEIVSEDTNLTVWIIIMSLLITTLVVSSVAFWSRKLLVNANEDDDSRSAKSRSLLRLLGRPFGNSGRNGTAPILQVQREMIPLNAMTDNPHYDSQTVIEADGKEIEEANSAALVKPEYNLLSSSMIQTMGELGEGAFGKVHLATLRNDGAETLVAVKVLKISNEQSMNDFDQEASLMATLTHSNIVHFYGACIDETPWKMVFEYMEHGDLNQFLRLRGPDSHMLAARHDPSRICDPSSPGTDGYETPNILSLLNLLQIAKQISAGMEYLASAHYVHRDLATRNCLVGKNLVVKIGDFGMSRDIYSSDYYRVGGHTLLPVRWMSPESILYRKFTGESDVWSFGVCVWEIFSFGKQPWYGLSNQEVIQQVTGGQVLQCPPDCPPDVYQLMLFCWTAVPSQRITMKQVDLRLAELCKPQIDPTTLYLDVIE